MKVPDSYEIEFPINTLDLEIPPTWVQLQPPTLT